MSRHRCPVQQECVEGVMTWLFAGLVLVSLAVGLVGQVGAAHIVL
jgi:hypothetical protein